jgi:hypothetical protein
MRAQPFKGSSPSWCDLRTGRDGVRSLHAYVGDAHTRPTAPFAPCAHSGAYLRYS